MLVSIALLAALSSAPVQDPAWLLHCRTQELEQRYFDGRNRLRKEDPVEALALEGKLDGATLEALERLRSVLQATFKTDLAEGGAWEADSVGNRTFVLAKPAVVDTIVLQGVDRLISQWRVEVRVDEGWNEFAQGMTLLTQHVLRGAPQQVSAVRVRSSSTLSPIPVQVGGIELYASPPRVRIEPRWGLFEGSQDVKVLCDFPGASIEVVFEGQDRTVPIQGPGQVGFQLRQTAMVRARATVGGREPGPFVESLFTLATPEQYHEPLALFVAPRPGLETLEPTDSGGRVRRGYINAPQAGLYRLQLAASLPCWLELGQDRLLVQPGEGASPRVASVLLKAGWHRLHLEAPGGANRPSEPMLLTWSGPGFDFQVPAEDHLGH